MQIWKKAESTRYNSVPSCVVTTWGHELFCDFNKTFVNRSIPLSMNQSLINELVLVVSPIVEATASGSQFAHSVPKASHKVVQCLLSNLVVHAKGSN